MFIHKKFCYLTRRIKIPLIRFSIRDACSIEDHAAVDADVIIAETRDIERASVNIGLWWHWSMVSVEDIVERGEWCVVTLDAVQMRRGVSLTVITNGARSNCGDKQYCLLGELI